MRNIIKAEGLVKTYGSDAGKRRVLDGVSFELGAGEFVAVMGPSGSGKTTFLNIVGCLDSPSAGTVSYDGRSLGAMKEDELSEYRKRHISFIFQSYNLIPVLTVRENVELPLVIERRMAKDEIRARADEVIAAVGLKGLGERYPRELSGGQEQRVAIARALVKDPYIVLADEPTANLDSHTAEEIVDIMREINRAKGATFIFSTHDPLVKTHARRVVTIRDGLVHADERK